MTSLAGTEGPRGSLRTVLFWMHLTAGVLAGLVILVMAVTGILLAYERQVLDWSADRFRVEAPRDELAVYQLPLDTLLARGRAAAATTGRSVVSLGIRADTAAPV